MTWLQKWCWKNQIPTFKLIGLETEIYVMLRQEISLHCCMINDSNKHKLRQQRWQQTKQRWQETKQRQQQTNIDDWWWTAFCWGWREQTWLSSHCTQWDWGPPGPHWRHLTIFLWFTMFAYSKIWVLAVECELWTQGSAWVVTDQCSVATGCQ